MSDEEYFDEKYPGFEDHLEKLIEKRGVRAVPVIRYEVDMLIRENSKNAYSETLCYVMVLRELQNIMRCTVHDDVWTEDGNHNVVRLKDRIEEITQEYQEYVATRSNRSGKQPAVSGKQPAVKAVK